MSGPRGVTKVQIQGSPGTQGGWSGVIRDIIHFTLPAAQHNNIMHAFQKLARNKSKLNCFDGPVKLGVCNIFAVEISTDRGKAIEYQLQLEILVLKSLRPGSVDVARRHGGCEVFSF